MLSAGLAWTVAYVLRPPVSQMLLGPDQGLGCGAEVRGPRNGGCADLTRSPRIVPLYRFIFGGGFPYWNRLQKKGYPYSTLSTGGPGQAKTPRNGGLQHPCLCGRLFWAKPIANRWKSASCGKTKACLKEGIPCLLQHHLPLT